MHLEGVAAKQLRFIDTYRSYVITYNVGRDLVAGWVQRQGGNSPVTLPRAIEARGRWSAFSALLSSPRLPADLGSTR